MKTKVSIYHSTIYKKTFDYTISTFTIIILFPLFLCLALILYLTNYKPIIFKQSRVGKNGRVFTLYKLRTMIVGAENLQKKYRNLNVSDGPTFKIPKDPRYTKFGKYLVKTGLDELPQLYNVIRGEMSIVGPRPLPLYEAKHLTKKDKTRELVLPGIVSEWVVTGAHNLSFKKWMLLDAKYVRKATLTTDISIATATVLLIAKLTIRKITKSLRITKNHI